MEAEIYRKMVHAIPIPFLLLDCLSKSTKTGSLCCPHARDLKILRVSETGILVDISLLTPLHHDALLGPLKKKKKKKYGRNPVLCK